MISEMRMSTTCARPRAGGRTRLENGGDVAGGVGGVEWTVASGSSLKAAEGEGEEVVDVKGEGCVGGAELDVCLTISLCVKIL